MITFFDALNFLCAKILGYKRRNCIADGYEDQRKNIFYPHRCRIPGKCLCAEGIYHCLHDHHTDRHCGLLQNRWYRNAKHGIQLLPVEPAKGALVLPHPRQKDQKRKHGRNSLCDQGRKGCTKHPQTKTSHHPEIHKNIQDRGEYQQSQRNFGFTDGSEHGGKNVVHE